MAETEELEMAILLEDYNSFPDDAHAARLHWISGGSNGNFKPMVINGRRVIPGQANENY